MKGSGTRTSHGDRVISRMAAHQSSANGARVMKSCARPRGSSDRAYRPTTTHFWCLRPSFGSTIVTPRPSLIVISGNSRVPLWRGHGNAACRPLHGTANTLRPYEGPLRGSIVQVSLLNTPRRARRRAAREERAAIPQQIAERNPTAKRILECGSDAADRRRCAVLTPSTRHRCARNGSGARAETRGAAATVSEYTDASGSAAGWARRDPAPEVAR